MSDYTYDATVVSVHDGDTLTLDVDLGFKISFQRMKIRMYGINAPELNTAAGKAAAAALQALLPVGTKVTLDSHKDQEDKYGGRWLGTISVVGVDMNQMMINQGHAKPYFGKGVKPV